MSPPKKPPGTGRKSPPEATQFKRGTSGNPSGRPKGQRRPKSSQEMLNEALALRVVMPSGKSQTVLELVIDRCMNRNTPADLSLLAELAKWIQTQRSPADAPAAPPPGFLVVQQAPPSFEEWERQFSYHAGRVGPDGQTWHQRLKSQSDKGAGKP